MIMSLPLPLDVREREYRREREEIEYWTRQYEAARDKKPFCREYNNIQKESLKARQRGVRS